MTIREAVRHGEPIERPLRRFKRKVDGTAILKIIKANRYYSKPSEKKRRKAKEAAKRQKLAARRGYQ